MKTKRLLFSVIAMALVSFVARAQESNLQAIPIKYVNYDICDIYGMMQQRNGDIITDLRLAQIDGSSVIPLGHLLYKLSPATLQFTDSLLLADTNDPIYFFAKDPQGEGNIRTNIEPDGDGNTLLRISHFSDDNLNVIEEDDVVVPLCEGEAFGYLFSDMIDCRGNLILKYYKETYPDIYEGHIARYALDGTLLYENTIPESQNFVNTMEVFKESPLEYCQWKKSDNGFLNFYVLDSTFQTKNTYIVNKMLYEDTPNDIQEYFEFASSYSTFVIPDGEDVLVAARYVRQDHGNLEDFGIAAARYELRTMQRKALVQFNDYLGMNADADCFGFKKMQDGTVYLLYREVGMPVKYWMTVVKMDGDLNVIWKRYCETPEGMTTICPYSTDATIMLDDGEGVETGFVIAGGSFDEVTYDGGVFYGILTHDGVTAVAEGGIEIRPYMFYPNPAQDQLRLQYSPDVQPKQIELYDLQGRLVRSQGNAFETFDLGSLPTGTYTLRVTMEDGQVFSDKVVKE